MDESTPRKRPVKKLFCTRKWDAELTTPFEQRALMFSRSAAEHVCPESGKVVGSCEVFVCIDALTKPPEQSQPDKSALALWHSSRSKAVARKGLRFNLRNFKTLKETFKKLKTGH